MRIRFVREKMFTAPRPWSVGIPTHPTLFLPTSPVPLHPNHTRKEPTHPHITPPTPSHSVLPHLRPHIHSTSCHRTAPGRTARQTSRHPTLLLTAGHSSTTPPHHLIALYRTAPSRAAPHCTAPHCTTLHHTTTHTTPHRSARHHRYTMSPHYNTAQIHTTAHGIDPCRT